MSSGETKSFARWLLPAFLGLAIVVVGLAIAWRMQPGPQRASEEVVGLYFTSLAALDVEENQRAAAMLTEATAKEPGEPALWANLAVAHLRLRDLEKAQQALQQAVQQAGDDPRIALLQAEVLANSGNVEAAIEQLRKVCQQQPDNIAAAYQLATLLSQLRSEQADAERLEILSAILERVPTNLRSRCEQARLAATLQRQDVLQSALAALMEAKASYPEKASQQLQQAQEAITAGDYRRAATALTFFENVVKPQPEYQKSLVELGAASVSAVGTPLREFLRLQRPRWESAPADTSLTFEADAASLVEGGRIWVVPSQTDYRSVTLRLTGESLHVGEATIAFPGAASVAPADSVLSVDLNFDFRWDLVLVGEQGCRLFLQQEDGSFTQHETSLEEFTKPWRSAWAIDIEADGDMDLLLSDGQSPVRWIRNNGDMTFAVFENPPQITDVTGLLAVDLDSDGDVDLAMLDSKETVKVWWNERSGQYRDAALPSVQSAIAFAAGDADNDGHFDLVVLDRQGVIRSITFDSGSWQVNELTKWEQAPSVEQGPTVASLAIADLDNNGAVDLVASLGAQTKLWLREANGSWMSPAASPALAVSAVVDADADGLLDLVGTAAGNGQVLLNRSKANYAWYVLQPRANTSGGDQRINSFGIGGRVELRAGYIVQTTAIDSSRVHFGLGKQDGADVARILWPNGTVQAEFDLKKNTTLVANQRLKGSCPWVFAYDGEQFQFIKDFIWRSPLGLRINAQDTAGVLQTLDRIKIPGSLLARVDDRYSLRITAELWETHFFDQVALLAVDHPAGLEVYVDERFVPNQEQDPRIYVTTPWQPAASAADHRGNDVTSQLAAADGVYVDGFELGEYQGVCEEHWIQFELPEQLSSDRQLLLVGNAWIYPTDSSINVAIAQRNLRPAGLVLEQQDTSGAWQAVATNLGFPAGKNKNVVIAVPQEAVAAARPLRLRTNLEVYWDTLGWCYEHTDVEPAVTSLPCLKADLRYRGFSYLKEPVGRRHPDTPRYEVERVEPQWSDLEGYYTRFGDVAELLTEVDDRYVIMNAGDELVFEYAAENDPPSGWERDFLFVGDGWVKDGDFNTAFSRWVRPLPTHESADYDGPLSSLEQDPIYQKHPEDWSKYHTRYVTPHRFHRGLFPPNHRTNRSNQYVGAK